MEASGEQVEQCKGLRLILLLTYSHCAPPWALRAGAGEIAGTERAAVGGDLIGRELLDLALRQVRVALDRGRRDCRCPKPDGFGLPRAFQRGPVVPRALADRRGPCARARRVGGSPRRRIGRLGGAEQHPAAPLVPSPPRQPRRPRARARIERGA